jgi:hypothetical protein
MRVPLQSPPQIRTRTDSGSAQILGVQPAADPRLWFSQCVDRQLVILTRRSGKPVETILDYVCTFSGSTGNFNQKEVQQVTI